MFNNLVVSKILENSSLNSLVSVLENLNINVMRCTKLAENACMVDRQRRNFSKVYEVAF